MATNKVVFGNEVIMDITDSTISEDSVLEGRVAYKANGQRIIGKAHIPTDVSELNNDAGYVAALCGQIYDATADNYVTPEQILNAVINGNPISIYTTYPEFGRVCFNSSIVATDAGGLYLYGAGEFDYQTVLFYITAFNNEGVWYWGEVQYKALVTEEELSLVATSGDYNDLSNKPFIPSAYDDAEIRAKIEKIITDNSHATADTKFIISDEIVELADKRDLENLEEKIDNCEGVNLLSLKEILYSNTVKGIKYTKGEDGWLYVSGTVTGTSSSICAMWTFDRERYPAGTYAISVENENVLSREVIGLIRIQLRSNNSQNVYLYSDKTSEVVTTTSSLNRVCIFIASSATGTEINGRIRIKLERGSAASRWTPAIEDVVSKGLMLGGRNLALNTDEGRFFAGELTSYSLSQYALDNIVEGSKVTVSFDYFAQANTAFDIYLRGEATALSEQVVIPASTDKRHASITLTRNSSTKNLEMIVFRANANVEGYSSINDKITISNVMLEFGNQESTWQLAPEDLDAKYLSASDTSSEYVKNEDLEEVNRRLSDRIDALNNYVSGNAYFFKEQENEAYEISPPKGSIVGKTTSINGRSIAWNSYLSLSATTTRNGLTFTRSSDSKSVTVSGTATATANDNGYVIGWDNNFKTGHKYAIIGATSKIGILAQYYTEDSAYIANGSMMNSDRVVTFSHSSAKKLRFILYIYSGTNVGDTTIYPRIHDLTEMFGYDSEPTIDEFKKMCPLNSYENAESIMDINNTNIVSSTYNIFNKDDPGVVSNLYINTSIAVATAGSGQSVKLTLKPNTTYTFSKMKTSRFQIGITASLTTSSKDCVRFTGDANLTQVTFTTTSTRIYLLALIRNNTDDANIPLQTVLDSIQITESDTVLPYRPYSQTDIITANVISRYFPNGMKSVYGVCDELDLANGVAIQRVGSCTVNTSSNPFAYESLSDDRSNYYRRADLLGITSIANSGRILTTIGASRGLSYISKENAYVSSNGTYVNFTTSKFDNYETGSEKASAFNSAYSSFTFNYPLGTPVETAITEEDLAMIQSFYVDSIGKVTYKTSTESQGIFIPITTKNKFLINVSEAVQP